MHSTFTTPDGLKLAYDIHGTGKPVLCLAGLTRNMDDFDPIVAGFSDRAMIIRLDSRGRGASDYDPSPQNYTIPQEAADAIALLDHLGIDRTAIIGTSRGGLIAMVLAATAKHRLSGVLLNDIGPELDPAGLGHIMEYLGRPCAYKSYQDAADKLPKAMGAQFQNVSRAQWMTYAQRLWHEGPDGLQLRYDPKLRDAVQAQSALAESPDLWPLFHALNDLPLAALRGANSNLLTPECWRKMRNLRPDMISAEVPDRGHVPFLDEPESQNVIKRFMAYIT
ncbi:alpha/beta fold hydrolase [Pacificibacter marinus]|uniref:Haloacetate dehalogenase H-1 n=1 Tax=Pacificibacter marinus TaxID=658057 RepID=A0A1Y5SEV7_9RHOB|nr:alpha/beta hydrolase [Pacificibacter marinus]SEK53860.1 Pimeloyl-ACP methyl ester carboxylesterase [Pacificibacter marinus]SLN39052.1 Haloacetate dehalogenase H-1 [Pacificibacter marinus]